MSCNFFLGGLTIYPVRYLNTFQVNIFSHSQLTLASADRIQSLKLNFGPDAHNKLVDDRKIFVFLCNHNSGNSHHGQTQFYSHTPLCNCTIDTKHFKLCNDICGGIHKGAVLNRVRPKNSTHLLRMVTTTNGQP